jgi:Tol biopolymer transport system component
MRSSLEIYHLATGQAQVIFQTNDLIEAPNWGPLDLGFLVNGNGRLFRIPRTNPRLIRLETGFATRCNNDHGFSPDGTRIAFSNHRDDGAEVFLIPATGGEPQVISPAAPSWFHGWSPDGKTLVYAAARGAKRVVDVCAITLGSAERQLTHGEGHSDGPEFSADGARIFYNCDRSGHAQIWSMSANGADQQQLFADDQVNWFPHPSPCGRHVLYLAYPPGTQGHPRDLQVALCLMDPDGNNRRRVVEMTGGQGSINVPCWAPDGSAFAFMRYALEP